MVVVAIVGILATMAIPQLKLFVDRARMADAQVQISAITTRQIMYRNTCSTFLANFATLGYVPTGSYYFNLGFNQPREAAPTGCVAKLENSPSIVAQVRSALPTSRLDRANTWIPRAHAMVGHPPPPVVNEDIRGYCLAIGDNPPPTSCKALPSAVALSTEAATSEALVNGSTGFVVGAIANFDGVACTLTINQDKLVTRGSGCP